MRMYPAKKVAPFTIKTDGRLLGAFSLSQRTTARGGGPTGGCGRRDGRGLIVHPAGCLSDFPARRLHAVVILALGSIQCQQLSWLVDSVGQIWSRKTTSRSYVEAVKRAYESNAQTS